MLSLVRQARRRLFGNELLAQGANAASVALGAFILLLLVGTQILNWQWTLVLPSVAAAAGFYLARRHLPSFYGAAQVVDSRMSLHDSLSTAFYFSHEGANSGVSSEVRQLQYDQAERLASSVDVRKAVPFTVPRTAYVMGALLLVASSLFALRYGLTRSLDLKPPLASILEQSLGMETHAQQAANQRHLKQPEPQMEPDNSGDSVQDPDQKQGDQQQDADASNASEEASDSKAPGDSKTLSADAKRQSEEGEKAESDPKDGQGDDRTGEGENPNGQKSDSKSDPKDDPNAKQDSQSSGDSSSLMSKVKDAVQNLLSRMKPQQGQQGTQQQSAMDQKNSQGKPQNGSKQQNAKDGQQQNGGQQGDAQEGQSGEEAQDSQDPQGKGTGKSENQQPSKQPGSGIGSQDGDKSIKQAEQLAAMGKISEIFGKRSANITGEATLEVQNTSQTLRTQYAQRGVQHSQNGAQINRDEIPVALQSYVEQYFEQVRKQQPPPKK
ncbi:MAG TPA: hypothetical protein VMH81_23505 [Bryobacteraceae bacterium]|nr:hypothetical protein [Bryobacteraceae bacterium]